MSELVPGADDQDNGGHRAGGYEQPGDSEGTEGLHE